MRHRERLDTIVRCLSEAKSAMRCSELTAILMELGFDVREGKKQGHRVLVHGGVPSFLSDSFTCGHGKNPEIKPAYIAKIIRLLRRYDGELIAYLEKRDEL